MKGYTTAQGYMGYVDGSYMLFASEDDYLEYVEGYPIWMRGRLRKIVKLMYMETKINVIYLYLRMM